MSDYKQDLEEAKILIEKSRSQFAEMRRQYNRRYKIEMFIGYLIMVVGCIFIAYAVPFIFYLFGY